MFPDTYLNSIAPLIVVDCFIITTIYQDSNLTLHYMPEHVFESKQRKRYIATILIHYSMF